MGRLTRLALGAVLVSCLVLGLLSLRLGWVAAPGLDGWTVPAVFDALGQEAGRDEQLDREERAVQRCTAAKREVAAEAAAGRVTLFEAAARFRDLDADAPETYRRVWRQTFEGATDEERYCHQVLEYVAQIGRERPGDAVALDRLRAQLDGALSRGDIQLPAPARTTRPGAGWTSAPAVGPTSAGETCRG
jgi:hypothetical protein